jgi:hypothetical protein
MMTKALVAVVIVLAAVLLRDALSASSQPVVRAATAVPLYRSSVVGTEFDFITDDDPDAFTHLDYVGLQPFEMPDKRGGDEPLVQDAYLFSAHFTDGTAITFALDGAFGSREAAEADVVRYLPRIGRLPSLYRRNIRHIVVHTGGADTTAFAEDKGNFFVIYSGNATERIRTHDLEETFFHEGTHASIQASHLGGAAWNRAKSLDGAYVTDYARTEDQEDFAESALFAYTLLHHPERFPPGERERIEQQIPNRIAFFKEVFAGE